MTFEDIFEDNEPTKAISVSFPLRRIQELIKPTDDLHNPAKPREETILDLKLEFQSLVSSAGQGMMAITYLLGNLLAADLLPSRGLEVRVKSHGLPLGAGLGSSAAFSVACSGAILQLFHCLHDLPFHTSNPSDLQLINTWAYHAEILIHGTPSGLDNTTSAYGGMIKFIKSTAQSSSSANHFEPLPQISNLKILLTNTKVPRSTKELVGAVRKLYDRHNRVMTTIFKSIEEISSEFLRLFER